MSNYGEYNTKELKKLQKVLTEMLKDINYVCDKYKIDYFALDGTGIGAMRHKGFIPWDDDIDLRFFEDDLNRFIECMSKEMPDKYYFIDIDNSGYPVAFTKMCKKGTLFLDDISKELGLENGIFIDLIRMVYVSEDEKTRKKAFKKSWIIYKLGTICAIKNPSISIKGIKGKVLKVSFVILHYLMKLLHVSYKKLFYKGEKAVRVDHKTSKTISLNTVKMYSYLFNTEDFYPKKKIKFEDTFVYVPEKIDKLLTGQFGDYMKLPPKDKRHNHYPCKIDFDYKK